MAEEIRIKDYVVMDDRLYTKSDEWVKQEGDNARIGVTDYAQKQLKDVVGIDLPEVGTKVNKGDVIATIDSIKTAADIYSPVTGEIVEINETLLDTPELINNDPYGEGWIAVIKLDNPEELNQLLKPEEYVKLLENK